MAPTARSDDDFPIQPHLETQQLIAKWVATGDDAGEEHWALLAHLEPLARKDNEHFVRQLAYAYYQLKQDKKHGGVFVEELFKLCRVEKQESATALAPYLYGEHIGARKLAWELLIGSFGHEYPRGYGDLSHLRVFLTGTRQNVEFASSLKRAIFEVVPNSAFHLFLRGTEGAEALSLLRAEHALENALFERDAAANERHWRRIDSAKQPGSVQADVILPPPWKLDEKSIAALRELATSDHWWARMFASEFMVQNKGFRVEELTEKLEQDDNDLVRRSGASIKTPDPLRAPVGPLRP